MALTFAASEHKSLFQREHVFEMVKTWLCIVLTYLMLQLNVKTVDFNSDNVWHLELKAPVQCVEGCREGVGRV